MPLHRFDLSAQGTAFAADMHQSQGGSEVFVDHFIAVVSLR
jgi:hypothetical protein